jgi:hypothetical protein
MYVLMGFTWTRPPTPVVHISGDIGLPPCDEIGLLLDGFQCSKRRLLLPGSPSFRFLVGRDRSLVDRLNIS